MLFEGRVGPSIRIEAVKYGAIHATWVQGVRRSNRWGFFAMSLADGIRSILVVESRRQIGRGALMWVLRRQLMVHVDVSISIGCRVFRLYALRSIRRGVVVAVLTLGTGFGSFVGGSVSRRSLAVRDSRSSSSSSIRSSDAIWIVRRSSVARLMRGTRLLFLRGKHDRGAVDAHNDFLGKMLGRNTPLSKLRDRQMM